MKKADSRLVRHLTLVELQSILSAPDPTTRDGIRDRAMMHLCFAAALRVSELVGVRLGDVTFQPSPCVLIRGKGRRERCLPLWKETVKSLRAWLAVRQLPGQPVLTPELFTNARGAAMSRSGSSTSYASTSSPLRNVVPRYPKSECPRTYCAIRQHFLRFKRREI